MAGETGILIPAYRPDEKMIGLLQALRKGKYPVAVVDDGGGAEYRALFDKAEEMGCAVLRHERNRGKGRALKTGLAYAAQQGWAGAVTADADGQHCPKDVFALAEMLEADNARLVLGVRDISAMPGRSRFGNALTRYLFRFVHGLKISDTQTGLRGIGAGMFGAMEQLEGERYEFETNMLIWAAHNKQPVCERVIETIYIGDNETSHFRPFKDGMRIYALLLGQGIKFAGASFAGFLVDYLLFALLHAALRRGLLLSTVAARAVSVLVNYSLNRRVVFRAKARAAALGQYLLLAAALLAGDYALMWLLTAVLGLPALVMKPLVGIGLYLLSYKVQAAGIFRR